MCSQEAETGHRIIKPRILKYNNQKQMSGKHYKFTLQDGTVIIAKRRFCVAFNLSYYQIEKLLSDKKGHFIIEGQKVKYQLIRQLIEPRQYIPNPKGRGNSKNKVVTFKTHTIRFGNIECEYCSNTNRLIRSRSVIINNQIIN
jgi:hypothetical protein